MRSLFDFWTAAKDEIKDAIRDCIDADTTETDMQKCTSNAEAIANMIRGLDENKPMILPAEKKQIQEEKESQRKEALGEDAIDEVDACMATKVTKVGAAKEDADFDSDCKDVYKNRIKRTCGTKVPSGKKDMEMALLKKAAEDMENKASAIKPEKDTDGETDLPINKDIELKARNTIKNKLKDRGFKFRELDMKLRQASEMYAIKNAAAMIRSKKEGKYSKRRERASRE